MRIYLASLFGVFLQSFFTAQTIKVTYDFNVYRYDTNTVYNFPAEVIYNNQSLEKLYTVRYGISDANLKAINPKENILSTYKSNVKSNYIIYSKSTPEMYIWDNIRGNNYIFFDDVKPMKWEIESETKEVNQKVLSKATTKFRGRTYIAWYDEKVALSLAPWKFNGIEGLVYEMYDENKQFSWKLNSIENLGTATPINPFVKVSTSDMQAFRSYPDLKYGIVFNPNEFGEFLAMKQERNGLEIQFEWEK